MGSTRLSVSDWGWVRCLGLRTTVHFGVFLPALFSCCKEPLGPYNPTCDGCQWQTLLGGEYQFNELSTQEESPVTRGLGSEGVHGGN